METVERRKSKRVATLRVGQILLRSGGGGISCIVRNRSPFGACLELANHFGVPLDIVLVIAGERFRRPCRVVWRGNKQIGVIFS
jgi:PilZ domain